MTSSWTTGCSSCISGEAFARRPLSSNTTSNSGLPLVSRFICLSQPDRVMAGCTEPLPPGVPDLRGVWEVYEGRMKGHVERIEQAGNRICITTGGLVHDMYCDGTLKMASTTSQGSMADGSVWPRHSKMAVH